MWDITAVEIKDHAPRGINAVAKPLLFKTVVFTFGFFEQGNPIAVATHVYIEDNVPDVSPQELARYIRDQKDQLDKTKRVSNGTLSVGDLSSLRALISGPRFAPPVLNALINAIDFAQTDAEIVDALNVEDQPSLASPPIDIDTLIFDLSDQAKAWLAESPNTPTIREDARRGDGRALCNWAGLALKAGKILSSDFATVGVTCAELPPPVSRAFLILGRAATVDDVKVARALAP